MESDLAKLYCILCHHEESSVGSSQQGDPHLGQTLGGRSFRGNQRWPQRLQVQGEILGSWVRVIISRHIRSDHSESDHVTVDRIQFN